MQRFPFYLLLHLKMSSTTQSRGQMVARYDRLKKRVELVKVSDAVSTALVDMAKTTLEMFPVTATSTVATLSSAWDDVESFMKSISPSPSEIFTEDFFKNPLFPVVALHDIAALYGCPPTEDLMMDSLGLPSQDKGNKSIKTHVWFADFLECDKETIVEIVQSYKSHRGSSDMIRRLSITPTLRTDVPHERDLSRHISDTNQENDAQGRPGSENPSCSNPAHRIRNPTGTELPSTRDSTAFAAEDSNDSRKATNVFQYFKDSKFTGDMNQSIELTIRDYNVCARQHKLSQKQKADFFVNVLADPARTFFFNNARDDMTFDEMARMMVKEYNSDARQLQVQGILETLRLDKYMAEQGLTSPSEGLTKLVDLIERLTPQCQPQFRSDANKINYLRKAVLGFNWSMVPIGNIITAKYSFNGFVTALREHLQLENEVNVANPSFNGSRLNPVDGTFHSQYGRNPKHVRKYAPPVSRSKNHRSDSSSSTFEESRRKGICHVSKLKWRPGHRCKPGSVHGYVRDRFKKGDSAVHIVSDLVMGLEGDPRGENEDESPPSIDDEEQKVDEVRFGEAPDELSLYDQLTDVESAEATDFVESVDKECFTNHLSAAFSESDPVPAQDMKQFF